FMATKTSHFEFDWWVVQKRALHVVIFVLAVCIVASGVTLYVWKFGNPLKRAVLQNDAGAGARFISFEGNVRVIHAATREVVVASNDIQLYPGDTVQTEADGRARIAMADGSTVVVRPNSTIIIRDNTSSEGGKRSNVHVVVDSGQMLVRTEQQSEDNKSVIETPKTQSQITGQTQASFGVNPEGTEEIRVNSGRVDSSTGQANACQCKAVSTCPSINPEPCRSHSACWMCPIRCSRAIWKGSQRAATLRRVWFCAGKNLSRVYLHTIVSKLQLRPSLFSKEK